MPIFFEQYLTNSSTKWDEAENYTEFYLNKILSLTNEKKCLLVVVGIPDKYQIYTDSWNELKKKWPKMLNKKWDMNAPTKRLTKILNKLNIPFIDLTPIFREKFLAGDRLYFKEDIHWNLLGNIVAAQTISKHIVKYIQ